MLTLVTANGVSSERSVDMTLQKEYMRRIKDIINAFEKNAQELEREDHRNLSHLYWSLYKISEGQIKAAVEALKKCSGVESVKKVIGDLEANSSQTMKVVRKQPSLFNTISPKEWANAKNSKLPPYPQDLVKFLEGDCTIWPGQKRSETYTVVPLFPEGVIDEESSAPWTLASFDKFVQSAGGRKGSTSIWESVANYTSDEQEFHFAVITNEPLPMSKGQPLDKQVSLLPDGHEVPSVFDLFYSLLWAHQMGKCHFNDWTYMWCRDQVDGKQVMITGHNDKLWILDLSPNDLNFGLVGFKKFPLK